MKHKMWSRLLSMALAVMMIASIVPNSAFAEAASEIVASSQATVEVAEETEEVTLPEDTTTEEPAAETPAEEPAGEPAPTAEPVAEPTAEPATESEQPTAEPTQAPAETAVPSEQPSAEPTAAPEGTETPEGTAVPTETPVPSASPLPSESPEATQEPETVEGVYNGMAADELFNAFLACQSIDEVDALLAGLTEEDLNAFAVEIGEDSMNALEAHFQALLDAEELPEEPVKEELPEDDYVEHVPEIVDAPQKIVPFTNAVPMFNTVSSIASTTNKSVSMQRAAAAPAANNTLTTDVIPDNGLQLRKWVEETAEGQYTVNLEVWTEGTVTSSTTTKPLDIVLVLDQSGSMSNGFTSVEYRDYTNQTAATAYSSYRSNTYVKLDNGSYSKVTLNRVQGEATYSYTSASGDSNSTLYSNQNRLYYLENEQYYQVEVTRKWVSTGWFDGYYQYTYKANNKQLGSSDNAHTRPDFTSNFYYRSATYEYVYEFTYTDTDGNHTVTLNADDIAKTEFNTATGKNLYYTQNSGSEPRLDALVTAVNGFIDSVAEKAKGTDGIAGTDDDVSHRIAIAGFSSSGYRNTELLTGVTVNQGTKYDSNQPVNTWSDTYYYPNYYQYNGPQYYRGDVNNRQGRYAITDSNYKNSLQDVSTASGLADVEAAVGYLTAHGGTQTDAGMDMANKIFNNNPFTEQDIEDKRDRVVIVFTDGIPTGDGSSYNSGVAENAINYANTAKTTYGADVYTIGIFEGADATDPGSTGRDSSDADKGNYFMQNLSSNNGIPQSPSYYLSASNSSELNAVFEAISETTGSSRLDLDEDTVVKDVLTQYFTVPAGSNTPVEIYTQAYDGIEFSGKVEEAEGVTATVDPETGEISVTGFDFSTRFISENGRAEDNPNAAGDYHGEKLIISFPIVPKEEFWGGNQVPTNVTETSGVFDGDTLVENFPTPDPVDVPLKEIALTGKEVNVYYSGEKPGATDLVNQITVSDDWTTDYVNRTIEYELVAEGTVSNETDGEYEVKATLKPLYDGTEGPTYASATGSVKVYKPELTWKDTTMSSGTVLTDDTLKNQLVNKTWKHENEEYTPTSMFGTEPTLNYVFHANDADGRELDQTQLTDETNVYVAVTSDGKNLNGVTTFIRMRGEQCPGDCTATAGGNVVGNTTHFCIHLDNGELTITKTVTNWNNAKGDQATFFFEIKDGNGKTYEQALTVTKESPTATATMTLPAGTYTVEELNGTSGYQFRGSTLVYAGGTTGKAGGQSVSGVQVGGAVPTVTFTNTTNGDNNPGDNGALNNWFKYDKTQNQWIWKLNGWQPNAAG